MGQPKIILKNIAGNDDPETIQMVKDGITMLNTIICNQEFKNKFLAFEFVQTNGKNNQELWDLFTTVPVEINVDIRDMGFVADHFYHTVGLDDARDPGTVYMNSYFVDSSYMVGDNALHEVWHILGLSHNSPKGSTSVPYGNNTIYEQVAKELGLIE
jgi:hypothetical protein